ncbi:MAG: hypothetical protein ACE5Q6_00125 [Dehalococcoidia bacterium]
MAKRREWRKTNVPWDRLVTVWERMALGDSTSQIEGWLEREGDSLAAKTIRRVGLELKDLPEELARDLPPQVQRLRWELRGEATQSLGPASLLGQLTLVERWRQHWQDLLQPLRYLRGIGIFAPGAREIQTWLMSPDPSVWPVPGGQVYLDKSGNLKVKLATEECLYWPKLQQHLPEGLVWGVMGNLRLAMEEDLAARRDWYLWVIDYVKEQLELPVLLEGSGKRVRQGRLLISYVNILYEQVFRRVAGLPWSRISEDEFWQDEEGNLCYNGTPVMRRCSQSQEAKAISLLIKGQDELVKAPLARAAGEAYRRVEIQTGKLKESLDLILALDDPPLHGVCDHCRSWAAELGVSQRPAVTLAGRDTPSSS